MKLIFSLLLALLSPISTEASDIFYFCKGLSIEHGTVQFIQIDNSDEFELTQTAKYLHYLLSKTKLKARTQMTFQTGSMKKEFLIEHDCEEAPEGKTFNLDNY